jgi:signal transducing adaptor molecule
LETGQIIDVYDNTTFHEWWKGESKGKVGIFPSNYVEKVDSSAALGGQQGSQVGMSRETSDEAFLQNNSHILTTFMGTLSRLDPRSNSAESDQVQVCIFNSIERLLII